MQRHPEVTDQMISWAIDRVRTYIENKWNGNDEYESIGNLAIALASEHWDQYRGEFESYCINCTEHLCINYAKAEKRRKEIEDQWRPTEQNPEETETVNNALNDLTNEEKGLAFLRLYHGFTLQEIADALEVPLSRIFAQTQKLQRNVHPLPPGDYTNV